VIAVGQNCPLISDLNLSDCGKGVNGNGIKAFVSNSKGLRIMNLGEFLLAILVITSDPAVLRII
jgi:hypothetical protein